jgi:type I site-specific restriction endonuclease
VIKNGTRIVTSLCFFLFMRQHCREYGDFDLIRHIAYNQPPLTRRERANNVRKRNYFSKYGETARAVLDALLDKYADEGILSLENAKILKNVISDPEIPENESAWVRRLVGMPSIVNRKPNKTEITSIRHHGKLIDFSF